MNRDAQGFGGDGFRHVRDIQIDKIPEVTRCKEFRLKRGSVASWYAQKQWRVQTSEVVPREIVRIGLKMTVEQDATESWKLGR